MELREKLKDLEERKANEFCMAMLNVRQGIKKLEDQLEGERRARTDLESATLAGWFVLFVVNSTEVHACVRRIMS